MAYSDETRKHAKECMRMLKEGKIRNHKLRNASFTHTGEAETTEAMNFKTFMPTRNCALILALKGERS